MPYEGWLMLGGNEIGNAHRVRAYAQQMTPGLQLPADSCSPYRQDLAAILEDDPYTLPHIDDAPWFDPDDPDTGRFCGFWPLTISNLGASSRTVTITENIAAGGNKTGERRSSMECRVTGLLLAADDAGLEAGRTWLTAALEASPCDPCEPASACYLKAVPDAEETAGDWTAAKVPLSALSSTPGRWNVTTGVFSPPNTTTALSGVSAPSPLPCDEVVYEWTLTALSGTVVTLHVQTEAGQILDEPHIMDGATDVISISDRSEGQRFSRCTLTSTGPVTVGQVLVRYRLPGDPSACFTKYARHLHNVEVTSPVRTIQQYSQGATAAMEMVEFTFTALVPYSFGDPVLVATADNRHMARAIPGYPVYPMVRSIPVCVPPKRVPLVVDPDLPVLPAPPLPVSPAKTGAVEPAYLDPYAIEIPADVIPLWTEVVPILKLTTGSAAVRGLRVRFFPRPLENTAATDIDPCSACGVFTIDYIPPNSTFTLDGMRSLATITQPGDKVSPAGHLLSGPTDTDLFEWPVLTCGTGYFAIVDVAGMLVGMELSVAVRE